jgi:hypothetical protein
MTVAFTDYVSSPHSAVSTTELTTATATNTVLNYNAPRKNGVYLEGAELDDFVCMLAGAPLSGALTQEEIDLMVWEMAQDTPGTITGGEALRAKHRDYLAAQGTPPEVIELLTNM